MSRAFVKEVESDTPEQLPELPLSPYPNYVTAAGLAELKQRLARVTEHAASAQDPFDVMSAHAEREIRWLRSRIATAILVDTQQQPHDRVAFGARVELIGSEGRHMSYRIVGEDEADPEHARISWISPLARVLLNSRVGDTVTWRRPIGDLEVEVASIEYPAT